jgi:hypothetical protein
MIRLTDSADDDGVVADVCACFHLEKKAVLAAVRAYRHASGTVHWFSASCLRIKTLWDVKQFTSENPALI